MAAFRIARSRAEAAGPCGHRIVARRSLVTAALAATALATGGGFVLAAAVPVASGLGMELTSAKVVQVGNGVGITLAPGWKVSQTKTNEVFLTHKSPVGAIVVIAQGTLSGTLDNTTITNIQQFSSGARLTNLQIGTPQDVTVAKKTFDKGSAATFSATSSKGKSIKGLAVAYENSTSGAVAFAVAVAPASSVKGIQGSTSKMFQSIFSNT